MKALEPYPSASSASSSATTTTTTTTTSTPSTIGGVPQDDDDGHHVRNIIDVRPRPTTRYPPSSDLLMGTPSAHGSSAATSTMEHPRDDRWSSTTSRGVVGSFPGGRDDIIENHQKLNMKAITRQAYLDKMIRVVITSPSVGRRCRQLQVEVTMKSSLCLNG